MQTSFRQKLRDQVTLLGTMVTLPCPATSEILAELGFDWLFIDGEHGPLESAELLGILQAVSHKIPCIVRVPAAGEVAIKKVLDLGAHGIIVPMVNTVQQAEEVVQHARYAPIGSRGVGLARAHGYGLTFQEYVESANESISVIVQTEHIRSVENIEEIVKVDGVDAIQLGPYDLAASMGKMGQVDDPAVVEAIDHVIATCQKAELAIGWFGISAEAVQPYIERGCSLITAGVDTLMLASAGGRMLKSLKDQ